MNEQTIQQTDFAEQLITKQDAIKAVTYGALSSATLFGRSDAGMTALRETVRAIKQLPSAQPELIEKTAYIRGFEQGKTQGMIDAQGEKMSRLINNTIKAEWTNADALDLQPTCNQLATDCISRQAAIHIASGYCHPTNIAKELAKLPSVQPKRMRGKWIDVNDGKWNTIEVLKCSVCGEIDNRMYKTDKFCPNCGANMRGDEDD